MPSTPISWRASLTASSLEVWMMASTLVMVVLLASCAASAGLAFRLSGGLPEITFFTVLREVEALSFLVFGNAEADELVNDHEDDERANDGEDPGDGDADGLIEQLMGVAFEEAGGEYGAVGVFENGIDGAIRENSGEEGADGAAGTVNAEGVERIVVAETRFHGGDHPEAECASDQADGKGGERADEARGGRDGDESGDAS